MQMHANVPFPRGQCLIHCFGLIGCSYLHPIQRQPSTRETAEYARLLRAILKDGDITPEESEAMVS